jgi:hypothetical protein
MRELACIPTSPGPFWRLVILAEGMLGDECGVFVCFMSTTIPRFPVPTLSSTFSSQGLGLLLAKLGLAPLQLLPFNCCASDSQ